MRPGREKLLLFVILVFPLLSRAGKFSRVTIFSNGPAGRVWSGLMGEYRLVGGLRSNGRDVWRLGEEDVYLFQGEDEHWYVGPDYNTTEVWGLRNQAAGLELVPENLSQMRWTYRDVLQKTSGETDEEIKIVQGSGWLCTVSEWSEWSSCSGYSGETRSRDRTGGRTRKNCLDCQKCPELSETEKCEYPAFLTVRSYNSLFANSWSGEYRKLQETTANGRPVWRHVDTEEFFFYNSDGYWMIDSDYSNSNQSGNGRGVITSDQANLELIPRSDWTYQDSGGKPDLDLTVEPGNYPTVVTIFSNGPAKWSEAMGEYRRHYSLQDAVTVNGRPVWIRGRFSSKQFYLFVDRRGQWRVGSDFEEANTGLWIRAKESGLETFPETGWEYWHSGWKNDSKLRAVPGTGAGQKCLSQLVGEELNYPDVQRHENVGGPSVCGNLCLETEWCRFWAWNYWSRLCQLTKEENPPEDSPYKTPPEGEKWTSNENQNWGGKRLFKPNGTQIVSLNEDGAVICQEQSDCPVSYIELVDDFGYQNTAFGCSDGICMDVTGSGCRLWAKEHGCQVIYSEVCAAGAAPLHASSSTSAFSEISVKRENGRCPNRLYCEAFDRQTKAPVCCLLRGVRRGVVGCPRSCN